MTSFFSFSSSSSTKLAQSHLKQQDDTLIQVAVTPSAAAFYAGEVFSATITFKCVRKDSSVVHAYLDKENLVGSHSSTGDLSAPLAISDHTTDSELDLPKRQGQIGLSIDTLPESYNAEAGPSRLNTPRSLELSNSPVGYANSPYSPGANPARGGWRTPLSSIREPVAGFRSPDEIKRFGETPKTRSAGGRRTQSLALGQGLSPQEMVWALGAKPPPSLPSRRNVGASQIPAAHPHSRKISVASHPNASSPSASAIDLGDDLPSIPESSSFVDDESAYASGSRPHLSRLTSDTSTSSSNSRSHSELNDQTPQNRSQANPRHRPNHLPLRSHLSPPPTHPYIRSLSEPKEMTILWAHTRLIAHFYPSNHYIPPDPLLPLRSLLLHQPVGSGSGSLTVANSSRSSTSSGGSRWQLSFGTGTIGSESKPSLTGSLVGLASNLVYGGTGGTLEDERKKAWNVKNLPVFETARSLLGVDINLKEGNKKEFEYKIDIPIELPPSHRGRAFKFGWDLVVSLAIAEGNGQRMKEIEIPIRVWNHVNLTANPPMYDVLKPIIQNQDKGKVMEDKTSLAQMPKSSKKPHLHPHNKTSDTRASLESYAQGLLDSLVLPHDPVTKHAVDNVENSRASIESSNGNNHPASSSKLSVAGKEGNMRGRKGSFIQGDEELLDEGSDEAGCGQAVEVLSRNSTKASYDIAKDGDLVSVFTLLKTTYRLGETILGVISINQDLSPLSGTRQVLKFSAFLESNDIIPSSLLPPSPRGGLSPQPILIRLHADHSSGYVNQTSRISFNLDIPSDATPGFGFIAGNETESNGLKREKDKRAVAGGVEWKIRLAFLVTGTKKHDGKLINMIPNVKEGGDNRFYTATSNLSPIFIHRPSGKINGQQEVGGKLDTMEVMETETVECEIPIMVLPGNTAFKVKPAVYTV